MAQGHQSPTKGILLLATLLSLVISVETFNFTFDE
jgi:hypothetical protein